MHLDRMKLLKIFNNPLIMFKQEYDDITKVVKDLIKENYNIDKIDNFDNIDDFIKWLIFAEYIETKWCPFKHLKNLKFNRPYYYYNANNKEDLKLISEILNKDENITCHNCIKKLNQIDEIIVSDKSIFKEYMNYLYQFG